MMINEKKTTVAYRCPYCGTGVTGVVGIFALSGDYIKLKCPCGQSALTISKLPDDKLRLTVPCIVCPSDHNFVVKKSVFFANDILSFACSYSSIDVCFIGTEKKIKAALDENEKILLQLLGTDNPDILAEFKKSNETYFDTHISDMIHYVLGELAQDNKIFCDCTKNGKSGEYTVEENSESVTVSCKICGAKKEIFCQGSISEQDFLNVDSITLQ